MNGGTHEDRKKKEGRVYGSKKHFRFVPCKSETSEPRIADKGGSEGEEKG